MLSPSSGLVVGGKKLGGVNGRISGWWEVVDSTGFHWLEITEWSINGLGQCEYLGCSKPIVQRLENYGESSQTRRREE